ncbi:hypothetical protein [Rufibacter quisquiliarum]|uniref:Acetyltransferase (GNAT) domain-containing protein n=1 Tax=Rufibacter quisquiliarum TaxID=1549639 RepID=A0A839GNU3_9BACT|nr:hypothetical protein [Rufibacter quisquiliarum]MBA9075511.1 hypothetical protein [Rufibacter quisquiliarum]
MLRYLSHAAIDFQKWDACLNRSVNGMIYGFSWYLNIISPKWEAIVKEEAGEYVTIMPIPAARKFGMRYVRQPLFAHQLGVFYQQPFTTEEWQQAAQLLGNRFNLVSSYAFNTGNGTVPTEAFTDFNCSTFTTYHLDLAQGYERIVSGYRKDRRWRINKAKRSGLTVQSSTNIDRIISIFHEYIAPKIAGVMGETYEYRLLRQLYQEANQRGLAQMYAAVDALGQEQAMGLFFFFNRQIIYIFNSSTPQGKRLGGIPLLVDFVLQKFAGQEYVFDFEAPEVDPISDFYSSFGSEKAHFLSISRNHLPAPVQWVKHLRMQFYRWKNGSV